MHSCLILLVTMRISIAIPVYNCEQYITRCIDSVLSQDYPKEKIEIIVVDDGSTDKSGALVDAYANRHDNIRVFHQPNQGVSVARNIALEHATGDYIQFLDSDDFYLHTGCLSHLIHVIKTESVLPDVVRYWMVRVDRHNEHNLKQYDNLDKAKVIFSGTGREFCHKLLFEGYIGPALYRTQTINELGLRFEPGIIWAEDAMFNLQLYLHAEQVILDSSYIYGYYDNENSATMDTDEQTLFRMLENLLPSIPKISGLLEQFNDNNFKNFKLKQYGKSVVTRLLMLNPSLQDTRKYVRLGFEQGIFPISDVIKGRFAQLIDCGLRHPSLLWLMSFPYRHIFLPYIKPRIAKNGK